MENRCDSIDALMYAYYEFMRNKEENQMLEKDKNCIEFSMHSMIATHSPYQEDTEITIAGMAPGKSLLLANNPFDIPCDVVVVSKRYFERLQTENEQLKKKLEDFLKMLYPEASESDIEKLVWVTGQLCWKEATGCNTPEEAEKKIENLKGSLRRSNSTMLKELDQCIDDWQKATGCSTPEEAEKKIKSYLFDINVLTRVIDKKLDMFNRGIGAATEAYVRDGWNLY